MAVELEGASYQVLRFVEPDEIWIDNINTVPEGDYPVTITLSNSLES